MNAIGKPRWISLLASRQQRLCSGGCGCPPPCDKPKTLCHQPRPIVPQYPCMPRTDPAHKGGYKKYQYLTLFVMLPLIAAQAIRAFSHEELAHEECRDYEFMRIRNKRYPWGDGVKTFFHNPHVNKLPGECSRELPNNDPECEE